MNLSLGVKSHTQNISDLMKQVQERVAGDILMALIQQVRKQTFGIHSNQP
jgi:hypothetical protein